MYLIFEVNPRS